MSPMGKKRLVETLPIGYETASAVWGHAEHLARLGERRQRPTHCVLMTQRTPVALLEPAC